MKYKSHDMTFLTVSACSFVDDDQNSLVVLLIVCKDCHLPSLSTDITDWFVKYYFRVIASNV